MPANLPPDYFAAERRYREANTPEEKMACLREMLAVMPKHKGTEHLQGDLKRRIAKLNVQAQKKQATSRASGFDHMPREGAGQIALVGAPNSGKSSILNAFTNANSDVQPFPFSTFKPVQGMKAYEDIQIQLVDLPPVSIRHTETWVFSIVRMANVVLLVVDLGDASPRSKVEETLSLLETHKIILGVEGEDRPQGPIARKKTLMIGSKADLDGSAEISRLLQQQFGDRFPVLSISVEQGVNNDLFKTRCFQSLGVIRVYTKMPGKKADMETPYILPPGSTVQQAARTIHKDLLKTMKYARLWGSEKYDGQRVERDHILADQDIIEIHT